jgi:hypothetical protein
VYITNSGLLANPVLGAVRIRAVGIREIAEHNRDSSSVLTGSSSTRRGGISLIGFGSVADQSGSVSVASAEATSAVIHSSDAIDVLPPPREPIP